MYSFILLYAERKRFESRFDNLNQFQQNKRSKFCQETSDTGVKISTNRVLKINKS